LFNISNAFTCNLAGFAVANFTICIPLIQKEFTPRIYPYYTEFCFSEQAFFDLSPFKESVFDEEMRNTIKIIAFYAINSLTINNIKKLSQDDLKSTYPIYVKTLFFKIMSRGKRIAPSG